MSEEKKNVKLVKDITGVRTGEEKGKGKVEGSVPKIDATLPPPPKKEKAK